MENKEKWGAKALEPKEPITEKPVIEYKGRLHTDATERMAAYLNPKALNKAIARGERKKNQESGGLLSGKTIAEAEGNLIILDFAGPGSRMAIKGGKKTRFPAQLQAVWSHCIMQLTEKIPRFMVKYRDKRDKYGNPAYRLTQNILEDLGELAIDPEEYMKKSGIKDRERANRIIRESLTLFSNITLDWTANVWTIPEGKKRGKFELTHFWNMQFFTPAETAGEGGKFGVKGKKYKLYWNPAFLKMLINTGYIEPYPNDTERIDTKKYPYAHSILLYLARMKNINKPKTPKNNAKKKAQTPESQKPPRDRYLKVSALLENIPGLPTYEELKRKREESKSKSEDGKSKKGFESFTRNIIKPLEKNLNALSNEYHYLTWKYCKAKAEEISEEEVTAAKKKYSTWAELFIYFELKDYPEEIEEEEIGEKALKNLSDSELLTFIRELGSSGKEKDLELLSKINEESDAAIDGTSAIEVEYEEV